MQRNRRALVHPDRVRVMFARMREELHEQHERHLSEMANLYRELETLRDELATLRELRATVLARQHADAELAALYRERAIARARVTERDPAKPVH